MKNIAETECICICTRASSFSDLCPSDVGAEFVEKCVSVTLSWFHLFYSLIVQPSIWSLIGWWLNICYTSNWFWLIVPTEGRYEEYCQK